MIDFRYHIVSIMAVFLALGLGILLGSSVVSDAVEAELQEDLIRARQAREEATAARREATGRAQDLHELIERQIAPWTVDGLLEGRRTVVFVDGDVGDWDGHVTGALERAGAQPAGTISFTDRWALDTRQDREELLQAMGAAGAAFEPTEDPAAAAFSALGESFLQPEGALLLDALDDAGFLRVQGRPDEGVWPPASSVVVILSGARAEGEEPTAGAASFARAVSDPGSQDDPGGQRAAAPTLVVSDSPADRTLVAELRRLREADDGPPLAPLLSTFDAATAESDPGGIGVIAALVAGMESRGGDFGIGGRAERFIPELGPPG